MRRARGLPTCAALAAVLFARPRPVAADPPSLLDRSVVAEATRRAVERAGLTPDVSRSLAMRARMSAWLPQVSVRVARGTGAATTLSTTSDRQSLDDSLMVDVRVSLALDRLVFDPHEVELLRAETTRQERRMVIETTVIELLGRLEQLRLTRPARAPESPEDVSWWLEVTRTRARLEQMTGAPVEALTRGSSRSP